MPTTLIAGDRELENYPQPLKVEVWKRDHMLQVSEFFCDTLQGEGPTAGTPATFLRLTGCTLDCVWCDTAEVWKKGSWYTFEELFDLIDSVGLSGRLEAGQHLILTGGSPLKQQKALTAFLNAWSMRYKFSPYVEVENECVLRIESEFCELVNRWNNSPKLMNSGMKHRVRVKPDIIAHTAKMTNSVFKFVIEGPEDWEEIVEDYIKNGVAKHQIYLMPCGASQEELAKTREIVAEMCVKHNVRFSDRLHVTIWNKKTGV